MAAAGALSFDCAGAFAVDGCRFRTGWAAGTPVSPAGAPARPVSLLPRPAPAATGFRSARIAGALVRRVCRARALARIGAVPEAGAVGLGVCGRYHYRSRRRSRGRSRRRHVAHLDDGVVEVAVAAALQVLEADPDPAIAGAGHFGMLELVGVLGSGAGLEKISLAVIDTELDLGAGREGAQVDRSGLVVDADVLLGLEVVRRIVNLVVVAGVGRLDVDHHVAAAGDHAACADAHRGGRSGDGDLLFLGSLGGRGGGGAAGGVQAEARLGVAADRHGRRRRFGCGHYRHCGDFAWAPAPARRCSA